MIKSGLWFVAILLLVMGAIFGGIAGFMFFQEYNLEQIGVQTEGIVIELAHSTDNDGGTTYAPVVRFEMPNGRSFEFQSDFYSSPPSYEVGQKVTVLYPSDRPGEAQLKGQGKWLIIIFGIVGGLELALGLFFAGKAVITHWRGE